MLLTAEELAYGEWAKVFRGKVVAEIDDFSVYLPEDMRQALETLTADPSTLIKIVGAEPALAEALNAAVASGTQLAQQAQFLLQKFFANLETKSVVAGTRNVFGFAAQGIGLLSDTILSLGRAYKEPLETALVVVDVVRKIVSSDLFQKVIDGLSNIPIVGWIIEGVVDTAYYVLQLTNIILKRRLDQALAEFAKQDSIDYNALFDKRIREEALTRAVMRTLAMRSDQQAPEGVFLPPFDNVGNMNTVKFGAVKVDPSADSAIGYTLTPGEPNANIGYRIVDGSLTSGFFLPANGQSYARDIGMIYTITAGVCGSWSRMALRFGEPASFSIEPESWRSAWESYFYNLYTLAAAVYQSGVEFDTWLIESGEFRCTSKDYGVGECKKSKLNKNVKLPAEGASKSAGLNFAWMILLRAFPQVRGKPRTIQSLRSLGLVKEGARVWNIFSWHANPPPHPDDVEWSKLPETQMAYWIAEQQQAVLFSPKALYVTPEDQRRFPAFRNKNLRDLWQTNVTALLNSQDWRRAKYDDMPDGSAKEAYAQKAASLGMQPGEVNPICLPGKMCLPPMKLEAEVGPSILGDPTPPPPPENELVPAYLSEDALFGRGGHAGGTGGGSGGGAAIALGAAAAALLFLRKR